MRRPTRLHQRPGECHHTCEESAMPDTSKPLAIITGASAGIGYELAKLCAQNGYDLLIAADQAAIHDAAKDFQALGAVVDAVEADLATLQGVDAP